MTLEECRRKTVQRLTAIYPRSEAEWMTRIIFEQLKGYSQTDLIMKADSEVSDFIAGKVDAVTERLLHHEPIQYIFGETRFYGLKLKVSPAVLIPRPETEQLVEMIINDAAGRSDLRVLDICTGSGCIAVALARNLLFPRVEAIDISPDALEVAKENARLTSTKITFSQADALKLQLPAGNYDIIVSNPPYIAEKERTTMDANVLDYEPELALFVPDSDPLRFYTAISRSAMTGLHAGGRLYFEINPIYVKELKQQMQADGWLDVDAVRDMQGLYRFISATRPKS